MENEQKKPDQEQQARRRRVWEPILNALSSLRLAVVLLALIAIAAAIGGIIPQAPTTPNAEQLYRSYGNLWYRIITLLSLDDVFHSQWFIALSALFSLNLLLCAVRRLRRTIKLLFAAPQPPSEADLPDDLPTVHWEAENSHTARDVARRVLRRHGYRVRARGGQLMGERFRLSQLAPDLIHLGILVILVGGLLGIFRFEGSLSINDVELGKTFYPCEKETEQDCIKKANFGVRIDEFGVKFYPESATVKDYWSLITIVEDGREVKTARIEVNRPLTHNGISFYQSTYGNDLKATQVVLLATNRRTGEILGELTLRVGESTPVPGTQAWVGLSRFFTSFIMTDTGEAINRPGATAENPAALLQVYGVGQDGEELAYRDIVFARFPQTHLNPDKPYRFALTKYAVPKRVGIRYSRNPGYPVVWWGFVMLMVGLCGAFYLRPKRVWVVFQQGAARLVVDGSSRLWKERGELEKLASKIEAELGKEQAT